MTPGEYFNFMCEEVLRDFQKNIIWDVLNNTKVGIVGSRQIGKSYVLAFASIILACGTSEFPGSDVLIISETEAKAKKIIRDVQQHLDKMERVTEPLRESGRGGLFDVVLRNGSIISAKPGKPTALQAYTGHVLVDELSLTNFETEELVAQALIVASSQPHLRTILCTNADDHGSFIHNFWFSEDPYWENRRSGWALSNVTIWDAYPEGLPDKIKEVRQSLQPKLWRKFYENAFLTGNSTFFDEDFILSSSRNHSLGDIKGLKLIAWDIGFTKDGSGILVCEVSDKIKVLEEHLLFNTDVDDQIDFIENLAKQHKCSSIVIDKGVGGLVVEQRLRKIFGDSMINGVSVTRNFYQRSAQALDRLLTEEKISINSSCQDLLVDLATFEKDNKNQIQIPKRLVDKTNKSHCDLGVALLLATEMLNVGHVSNRSMEVLGIEHTFGRFFD